MPTPINKVEGALSVTSATTTQTSSDIINTTGKGLILFVDFTAGGVQQVETATAAGAITGSGNLDVVVTAAGMTNSPKTVVVAVTNGDSAATWAGKVRAALTADPDVATFFTVSGTTTSIILTALTSAANDATMNISLAAGTATNASLPIATSANTTAGSFPSLTPSIRMKDSVSGKYIVLWSATAAITALSTKAYSFYPAASFATTGFTEAIQTIIPHDFALRMTHGNSSPATYSVSCVIVP